MAKSTGKGKGGNGGFKSGNFKPTVLPKDPKKPDVKKGK